MRKSLYFVLMKIHTHDFSFKHNKFIKIMTKSVQRLKFTVFLLKRPVQCLKIMVHATCHNSILTLS
jgi:hypothetical protein